MSKITFKDYEKELLQQKKDEERQQKLESKLDETSCIAESYWHDYLENQARLALLKELSQQGCDFFYSDSFYDDENFTPQQLVV